MLDSGATHPLRAGSPQELEEASKVAVVLAGDEKRVLSQNKGGTILAEGPSPQILVPLRRLVEELGCAISWQKGRLRGTHPEWGVLKTKVTEAGCPILAESDALRLIDRLEEKKLRKFDEQLMTLQARLSSLKEVEKRTWADNLRDYVHTGDVRDGLKAVYGMDEFEGIPEQVVSSAVEEINLGDKDGWEYLKEAPLPRRERKRLLGSRKWVLNLFSGKVGKKDPLISINGQDRVLLNVDILDSSFWDLRKKGGVIGSSSGHAPLEGWKPSWEDLRAGPFRP